MVKVSAQDKNMQVGQKYLIKIKLSNKDKRQDKID